MDTGSTHDRVTAAQDVKALQIRPRLPAPREAAGGCRARDSNPDGGGAPSGF